MENALDFVLRGSVVLHVAMIAVCVWRVWCGENVIDRLLGADLIGTLVLALLVLLALVADESFYIDIALALAALSAIGTIALAKYFADQQTL